MKYEYVFGVLLRHFKDWSLPDRIIDIGKILDKEVLEGIEIYPKPDQVFLSLYGLKPEDVKVVIIGQDCYHTPGVAHGLAFSTKEGNKIPPSLQNIFKEIKSDLGIFNTNPNLTYWKGQGVLLLNASLTVRKGEPNSHYELWKGVTNELLKQVAALDKPLVYILWGKFAKECYNAIGDTKDNHLVLSSAHPSPFSADRGFFGSKVFSKTNEFLRSHNIDEIDWRT